MWLAQECEWESQHDAGQGAVQQHHSACLAEHIRVGDYDPQVNVHWRHDATFELEFSEFDSLQEAVCLVGSCCRSTPGIVEWLASISCSLKTSSSIFFEDIFVCK